MSKFAFRLLCLMSSLLSSLSFSSDNVLHLKDNSVQISVPIETLQAQSTVSFSIFAPYRGRRITVEGLYIEDVIQKYLGTKPTKIRLIAIDGYQTVLENWKKNHWFVVTKEDGKVLTIKEHGPVRVIEKTYGNRDANNLRNFNDWIWMLKRIEVLE